jgi:hypothetical protein
LRIGSSSIPERSRRIFNAVEELTRDTNSHSPSGTRDLAGTDVG